VSSLSGNLQRLGMEKIAKVESLQEIIADMAESTDINDSRSADRSPASVSATTDIQ